jgi:cell division protein YceG involved in septum cleavage
MFKKIKAAIEPTDSNNWYFVADCRTMKTVFTKTDAEHIKVSNAIKASGCKF